MRLGQQIQFRDQNATVSDGTVVVRDGVVNGDPIVSAETGLVEFVPVWAERDKGREPTTIIVHVSNVLGEVRENLSKETP